MTDPSKAVRPRGDRHPACAGVALGVSVARSSSTPIAATLIDLSAGGAKLVLSTPIPFEESITLLLENPKSGLRRLLNAEVRWVRPGREEMWVLGCSFDPLLSASILEELVNGEIIDHRRFIREPVRGEATVDWELGKRNVAVQLVDLSEGGFCMFTPEGPLGGERLQLTLWTAGQKHVIPARAKWQRQSAEGFLVGCEFSHNQGYYLMRALLFPPQTTLPKSSRTRIRLLTYTILGMAAILVACLYVVLI